MKNELLDIKKEVDKLKSESAQKSEMATVPYIAYEAEMERLHKIISRLILTIAMIICGILLYSSIPDNYSSQDIKDVDNITESDINNGGK